MNQCAHVGAHTSASMPSSAIKPAYDQLDANP